MGNPAPTAGTVRRGRHRATLTSGEIATVLKASTAEHDWSAPLAPLGPLVAGRDLSGLRAAAAAHGVDSLSYLTLRGLPDVDAAVMDDLGEAYRSAAMGHVRALADLDALGDALPPGVPWLVFKGPVLSELLYTRPDLRGYGDLDVLVPRRAFADVVVALERSGLRVLDTNWNLLAREERGQVHIGLRLGTPADVHWHLVNRAAVRRTVAVPGDALFGRSRRVRLGGRTVSTLHPVDTLLHLCLHAALPGGRRLLWLKDIERALATDAPDWDDVVATAHRWRVALPVAAMLLRVQRTLGASLPPEVVTALAPSRLRREAVRRAAASWSLEVPPRLPALTPVVLPSLRDSAAACLAAVSARLTTGDVTSRLARRVAGLAGGDTTAGTPAVFAPGGDEDARARYLQQVGGSPEPPAA